MKVLVFDFDGTLADSLVIGLAGVNQLATKYNYSPITDTDYIRQKGMRKIVQEDLHLKWYQLPFYVRSLKKVLMPKLDELELFAGIPELIKDLSADGHQLYILTSNIRPVVDHMIEKYQLHYFKSIFAGIPTFRKHRVIKRLITKQKLSADEILYIGDEVRDLEACKKVGIQFIGVNWGLNDQAALEAAGAEEVATSPIDLLSRLRQWSSIKS